MLKWAVGQRPSTASSTCSELTSGVVCCPSTFSQNTFTQQSSTNRSPTIRAAYVRNLKTANKENRRKCKRSLEAEMVKPGTSASARNRDSIYMHLDSIPAALRDVSNHWSPGGGENSADCATKPNKRRHVRLKKSPCKVASHKFNEIFVRPVHNITEANDPQDEMKKDIDCESSDIAHVTQPQMFKELIETKKQPCKGSHTFPANSHNPPILAATELNRTSMLIENPVYFTVQTSPPEEPDELFHKELPVKRCRPMLNSCDNQNQNQNRCSLPLVFSNDDSICDIASNPCEMSTLTTGLSWLKLNARKDTSRLRLLNISSPSGVINTDKELDKVEQSPCNSTLEITNSNSTVFSDDNQSNLSLNTSSINRSKLKRKFTNENLTYVISTANETKVPEIIEKIKSKRRCVVFNEQSFTLSTPPVSEDDIHSQYSSFGIPSIDLDKPSTLTRQKVIRRKNKRISTVPQSVYNKNLKSWLTLPNGIPSPFEVNETNFKILSGTPMTTFENCVSNTLCNNDTSAFSIMKKAVSTPKQDCLFNLTEDVFLSPGVQPLLDSVIIQSLSDNTMAVNSKPKKEEEDEEKLVAQDEDDNNYHPLSVSELTWNSHGKHLPKAVNQKRHNGIYSSANSMQSSNSSRINDDQDVFSSIVSSTPTLASSPMTTKDKQHPRSRRCLSFVSPTTSRSVIKQSRYESGQLDLRIYYNNGLLTVHIIRAKNLQKIVGNSPCNAYVKVNLVPQGPTKSFHRTCVRKNSLNPKFDHKFSIEISESDLSKRVLISAWHRDRWKQKSEFLGCMSFAVKNILRKDINGSYKLLPQISNKSYASQILQSQDLMANQTLNTVDEQINFEEVDRLNVPAGNDTSISADKLKSMTITKKEMNKVHEEYLFLQHLELDPTGTQKNADGKVSGRTPFTTTHRLLRQPNGSYGFSIAWTHPPRVERVEANLPADVAGLKPGDNVIFVNKTNVVTLSEQKILGIIKNGGNQLVLEIYRKPITNGTVANKVQCISTNNDQQQALRRPSTKIKYCEPVADNNNTDSKSTTAYSTATETTTTETSKKRLQLPQITFSSEDKFKEAGNTRQHFVYELLEKEQRYALCLQFGISRFLLPLAERRDVIRPSEHQILFQNVQELLRITEDILEKMVLEENELFGRSIGKIYMKKFPAINSAYKRYCCGLKKADCILVEKTRCGEFMRLVTDPPIPKKRPDLISFIHKPLEHYRDILKILQSIANCKESKEHDHHILSKLILEMQTTYRNITVESGLMDCGSEGRPILSLQDLESRLVFTRCKPFTLNTPGRKWIFAGDLNRVEGKSTRLFWALLFSDILVFTKINRDKVVFVTEEPLPLASVVETQFYIKKRDTEFRLLIRYGLQGNNTIVSGINSPSQHGCVPLSHFHSPLAKRVSQSKDLRRRTLVFRAPSSELKAVWQNLIQRQVIKINTTGQGITPASSPVESPKQLTRDSLATADTSSTVFKRQCDGPIDDIIEHKCYMLGKSTGKGKAFHLAQWMRGELDRNENLHIWSEPQLEIWSKEMLQQRIQYLDINFNHQDNLGAVTEVDLQSTHSSKSSTKSYEKSPTNIERRLLNNEHKLCKKCHQTCLQFSPQNRTNYNENIEMQNSEDAFLDCNSRWSDVPVPVLLSPIEPFNSMSILAGTPQLSTSQQILNDDEIRLSPQVQLQNKENSKELHLVKKKNFCSVGTEVDEKDSDISDGNMPCKSLQKYVGNGSSLKRYAFFSNLNVTTDNEDIVDHEPPQNMIKIEGGKDVSTKIQSMISWANRATTFVTEQVALFEKIGENVQNSTLFDSFKYLQPTREIELTSTSQTLAFEEDYENSGGTSGDEFWGTPNSGGTSVASNEAAALSPSSSHHDEEDNNELQIIEEMLLNRTTAMLAQQHNMTTNRMLQNKFRLETLPEDEEEYNTRSSSASSVSSLATSLTASECTLSCSVPTKSADHNSVVNNNLHTSFIDHSSSVFTKIKLWKSQSMENSDTEFEESVKKNYCRKPTHRIKKSKLLAFFCHEVSNNKKDKCERKFWLKLPKKKPNQL